MANLSEKIRAIPDFPKEGILFRDITTLLADIDGFKETIDKLTQRYKDKNIEAIVCMESRGFIFGAPLAYNIGASLIPVRKPGKLPAKTYQATYELEYGTDTLEIHQDAFKPGTRVLILDDLLATGGTTKAVIELVNKLEGNIVEIGYVIELDFLEGRKQLPDQEIFSLINY